MARPGQVISLMRALAGVLSAQYILPAQALEPFSCRHEAFLEHRGDIRHAEVVARKKERVYFRDDDRGCPENDSCIRTAYLVRGDRLLVSGPDAGWACAWYDGKKDDFVGWLPAANIRIIPSPEPPSLQNWLGVWSTGSAGIQIDRATKNVLRVSGDASWGGNDTYPLHEGSFGGTAAPSGGRMTVSEDGCAVHMELVADHLVVVDNGHCGGANVRFNGVYKKQ